MRKGQLNYPAWELPHIRANITTAITTTITTITTCFTRSAAHPYAAFGLDV
ncbi:hypothetical protein CGRA01v4_12239 [Colletotrichum graminicola]|nr:hypothetical protein CGRA01v4_12239 [Colletotrichum graminicola]